MNKFLKEYKFFQSQERNMKVILLTNMLYALVLPVVEIFAGAYIMRNTNDPAMVAYYQLAMYVGVVTTSLVNGFLLKLFQIKTLYAAGILVSGVSLSGMMLIKGLGFVELGLAGFFLGAASGFFWTNRYLLTLYNTKDENRNYFFGLESFFFSIANITVPLVIGAFISGMDGVNFLGITFNANASYKVVTSVVFVITIIAVSVLWKGNCEKPQQMDFLHVHF
ncbi:MAG: MFS transporter, partial [Hoylesella buccalis]